MTARGAAEVSRKEVETAFAMCSPDEPSFIKISDLKLVMRALGFDPRSAQVEEMANKLREDQKKRVGHGVAGSMSVDEFLELMRDKLENDKTKEEMRCAFKLFDKEGKGWITAENLKQVAHELGEHLTDADLNEMISEADGEEKGKVNEEAFFRIMKRTCLY